VNRGAVAAILTGIVRSSWRDLRSLGSITGNNILAIIVLMMANEPPNRPSSATFYLFIIGILFIFPLSADVLRQIPVERFRLWPLSNSERITVRVSALALNPMLVIAAAFTAVTRHPFVGIALGLLAVIAETLAVSTAALRRRAPHLGAFRFIPRIPGRLGGIVQNHLRVLAGALDIYFALVLAVGGAIYCYTAAQPDPQARLMIGLLVVLFLSTLAQCQFGFDSAAEQVRYRLLPLTGVQILLAKDLAWLAIAALLSWPFHLLPSAGAACAALAIGHDTAVRFPIPQRRWRFSEGRLAPAGIIQIMALVSAGIAIDHFGWWMFFPFFMAYAASLWWYGRAWDKG
jgi:hypothetical protein